MAGVKVVWLPSDTQAAEGIEPADMGIHPTWSNAFIEINAETFGTDGFIMHTYDAARKWGQPYPSDLDGLIERVFVLHDESQFRAYIDTPNTPHQEN